MKKLLVVVIAVCFMFCVTTALYAETVKTSEKWCHSHNVNLPERDDPLGLGVNVKVIELPGSVAEDVTVETKYDFENEETSVFAVLNLDISGIFKQKNAE